MDAVVGTGIYTPVDQALTILRQRRRDPELMKSIVDFLGGDIPDYLLQSDCFVLPRHIATPNNEALYVLEQARKHGAVAVFSQDPNDKFTSVNNLKRRLARPEIHEETSSGPSYRKIDIVDLQQNEGKRLHEVHCRDGQPLIDFHNSLFDRLPVRDFIVADDSDWIDRKHRGAILNHYRCYLALFIAHGVLFEEFETGNDQEFYVRTVRPLLGEFRARWGLLPLIVMPCNESQALDERFYLAHPTFLLPLHIPTKQKATK